jgi:hypothetical protein
MPSTVAFVANGKHVIVTASQLLNGDSFSVQSTSKVSVRYRTGGQISFAIDDYRFIVTGYANISIGGVPCTSNADAQTKLATLFS